VRLKGRISLLIKRRAGNGRKRGKGTSKLGGGKGVGKKGEKGASHFSGKPVRRKKKRVNSTSTKGTRALPAPNEKREESIREEGEDQIGRGRREGTSVRLSELSGGALRSYRGKGESRRLENEHQWGGKGKPSRGGGEKKVSKGGPRAGKREKKKVR